MEEGAADWVTLACYGLSADGSAVGHIIFCKSWACNEEFYLKLTRDTLIPVANQQRVHN